MAIENKTYYAPVEENQPELLDMSDWKKEWQGMPEFVQEEVEPYAAINVRFASENDLKEFSRLIKQDCNQRTKSIWYPKAKGGQMGVGMNQNERYQDES